MKLTRVTWIAGLVLFSGCQEPVAEKPEIEPRRGSFSKAQAATSERPQRDLDPSSLRNMSELIAGLLPESSEGESPSPVWQKHGQLMDETWQRIEERFVGMRTWAERELGDMTAPQALLLYPFGGPDLITAMQFFPQSGTYLLIGLEAPGSLPMPEDFNSSSLGADLERLRVPFASFVESGYFIRSEIDKELSGGHFNGVLPILLACLIRAGQIPIDLDYVAIDADTLQITQLAPDVPKASAVRIKFLTRDAADLLAAAEAEGRALPEVKPRAVYYFAQDLSNSGILPDDPFSRLIEHQQAINVYIKSGEYLAHTDEFSNFRKLVLDRSRTLLQDDSGLPIRFFRSDRWDLRLYGTYTGVLAAYSPWFQEDLAAAFAKPDAARPLDFAAGYNTTTDGGGLILASRKESENAPSPGAVSSASSN